MKNTLIIIFFLTWAYFFVQSESKEEINKEEFETTAVSVVDSLQMQDGLTPVDQDNPFVVYAGRFETTTDTKYSSIGTPTNRNWMTKDEWDGKHIVSMDIPVFKKRLLMTRFKTWKQFHKQSFINYMQEAAKEEKKVFPKLDVSVVVAQAILESNFGLSKLCCDANNLFGHKFRGQKEGFVVMADDSPTDKFTKFRSEWFSIRAHSLLLIRKYGKRIKGKPTTKKWLHALCGGMTLQQSQAWVSSGKSTYATSCYRNSKGDNECYSEKLLRVIRAYDL
jgi:hypothetical protein